MLSTFRIFEITLYALINFVPYMALMVFAFYKHPRFSKPITVLICMTATFVQIATRFWSVLSNSGNSINIILLRTLVYTLLLLAAINALAGKVLFVELIFLNISSFIMIAASCVESLFFSGDVHRMYCWHVSMLIAILHLIITVPFFFTVKRRLKPMVDTKAIGKEWAYYWTIPATFYMVWQFLIYGSEQTSTDAIREPRNVIFLLIINVGAFLIYYMVIRLSNELSKNLELEKKNHYLDIEKLEYQILEERIEDARRARHDMRHHFIMMSDYLEAGDYEKLREYMSEYRKSVSDEGPIVFCPHRTINGILIYFARLSNEQEIDFEAQVSIPDKLNIPDIDISVLLGNLLENAIDACVSQTSGKRKISIRGNADKNSLFFTLDNTCDNEVKQNKKGQFISTKKDGSGIGIESVKNIVERYDGVFTAEKKGNMFFVSFMLKLSK